MSNKATQFKKNDPRINRKGAPKREWTWAGVLEKAVEAAGKNGLTIKEEVAKALIKETKKGNIQAIKELMNRMDGMPNQSTDITTGGDKLPAPIYGGRSRE